MPSPYIGVTGFETLKQVDNIARMISGKSYLLMNGVLVSHKTLNGQPNNWPMRYPKREDVTDLFSIHSSVMNIVHYNTREPATLVPQLLGIIGLCHASRHLRGLGMPGPTLDGFQLNMRWPDPNTLRQFKELTQNRYQIILQIGKGALSMANTEEATWYAPQHIVSMLSPYQGITDYILLDPSSGLGLPLEIDVIDRYLEAIYRESFSFGIGIAGGFSKETARSILPLVGKYHDLSVDAEGKLRDEDDRFSMDKATAYVEEMSRVLMYSKETLRT
ncbi:MAG: hypothetical protein JWN50_77 [Parcubacteria group bacterium]|nr:hypothetical protein [Parcubacteria group bacterium]